MNNQICGLMIAPEEGTYMNITFLGATKTVTGSNFLVEGAGKKFLVDCRNVSRTSKRRNTK